MWEKWREQVKVQKTRDKRGKISKEELDVRVCYKRRGTEVVR